MSYFVRAAAGSPPPADCADAAAAAVTVFAPKRAGGGAAAAPRSTAFVDKLLARAEARKQAAAGGLRCVILRGRKPQMQ
jgi:hypothetical protein